MSSTDEQAIAELRELMRQQGVLPLPAEELPDPSAVEQLLWRIRSEDRRRRTKRGAILASAATAVTAVALTLSTTLGSSPAIALPSPLEYSIASPQNAATAPPARDTLLEIAKLAAAVPLVEDGDVHFVARTGWLLSIHGDAGIVESDLVPTVTQFWLAPDGSARMDQARGPALDLDGQLTSTTLPEPDTLLSSDLIPPGTLDPHLTDTLSREPNTLRDALLTRRGAADTPPTQWAWLLAEEIADLHGIYAVPGDLAAAMWQVLAASPSVHDLGHTTTRDGHPAHGIAVRWDCRETTDAQILVLHASTDTGQLLGTEHITLTDTALGIAEPTLTGFEVWLRQGRTHAIPATSHSYKGA